MERPVVATNCQQICAPLVDPGSDRAALELTGITISCFVNEVPPFAEAEMENLYGSLYSSLNKFRIYGGVGDASTYVVRKDGKVIVVFLFRLDKGRVQVMNEVIKIDEEEIRRFSETIFLKFKSASVISFNAIQTDTHTLPFPFQRFNYSEDIVVALPGSAEEYLASLGKATRQNIKYYTKKLKWNFPLFSYQFYEKEVVTELHIRDILRLKLARMADKNKVSGINEREVDRILALVKECGGLVAIATIDGRVCGGQIIYRVGSNDFLFVIAHDPEYNDYSLGTICCYLTICECITRGGKEFHFLWGQDEYKYRFLGVARNLDHLAVYRSRIQFIFNGDMVLKVAFRGGIRQAKLWLHDAKRRNSYMARIVTALVVFVRKLNRIRIIDSSSR